VLVGILAASINTEETVSTGLALIPVQGVSNLYRILNAYKSELNVVVEWLIFLPRIREIHCSNLDPETGYRN
jgi:hypothetical protein